MTKRRIAVGGSAANPPHLGHLALLKALLSSRLFDEVIWILSGTRPDKSFSVSSDDRVAMTEMMLNDSLRNHPTTRLTVNYDDVYGDNTSTIRHLEMVKEANPDAIITWFTGADSVIPRPEFGGRCEIESIWVRGEELMAEWQFLVITRQGYEKPTGLASNFTLMDVDLPNISSSDVRSLIMAGHSIDHLVSAEVAGYIQSHGLYEETAHLAYNGYFQIRLVQTEHGQQEVVVATDSVSVLFYDSETRRVLLTRQQRPAMIRPDNPQGYVTEPVAGRFDVDLGPRALIIKEVAEEVGAVITEDDIVMLNNGKPVALSSGLTTERSYLAFVELKPGMVEQSDAVFGVVVEGEQITQVWMDVDKFLSEPVDGVRTLVFKEWLRNRLNTEGEI